MSDEQFPSNITMPGDEGFRMPGDGGEGHGDTKETVVSSGAVKTFQKLLVDYGQIWNKTRKQLEEFAMTLPGEGMKDPKILCFLMLLAVRTERRKEKRRR